MNISTLRKTRRNNPPSPLYLLSTLILLLQTTLAYPSVLKPRNLSTAEVFQKLSTLPGGYLTLLSKKHKLKECSLSNKKCGQNNEYKYCSQGCCNWDGFCENISYCPDNGYGNYNLHGFNECVYDLLDFQGNQYAKEVEKVASFEKEAKVALETCPASKKKCGKNFGEKFCTSGCCSDTGNCGQSERFCFGNANEKYDDVKLNKCLEEIGHGFVAPKNDGSPQPKIIAVIPDANKKPTTKSEDKNPEEKGPSTKPEEKEPTTKPEEKGPTTKPEEKEVPAVEEVPPVVEVSTKDEATAVTPEPSPKPLTLNRKIHDLVYSLLFISIFAFVFTYYILPALIYCCCLRKKMENAKFNKSRCFLVNLTILCPLVMVILIVKAIYKKRYRDMIAKRLEAKGGNSIELRDPNDKEMAKGSNVEESSNPVFIIGDKYECTNPNSPCAMQGGQPDKVARRESMRRGTFNKIGKKSDFSDKVGSIESDRLQCGSPGMMDSQANFNSFQEGTIGTMADMPCDDKSPKVDKAKTDRDQPNNEPPKSMVSIDGNLWKKVAYSSSLSDDRPGGTDLSISQDSNPQNSEKLSMSKGDEKITVSHFAKKNDKEIELSKGQNFSIEKIAKKPVKSPLKKNSFKTNLKLDIEEINEDSDHWDRKVVEKGNLEEEGSFDFDTTERSEKTEKAEKVCVKNGKEYDDRFKKDKNDLTASEDSDRESEITGKKK